MTWDPHKVLHSERELPASSCSECAIDDRHRERWSQALAAVGGDYDKVDARQLAEFNRQDWIAWRPDVPVTTTIKHDKEAKINAFIVAHHGEEITLQQIIDETGCAQGTAYAYVRDMALSFRRVGTSRWRVTDSVKARAEAARIAQDTPSAPGAVTSAPGADIALQRPKREPSKP